MHSNGGEPTLKQSLSYSYMLIEEVSKRVAAMKNVLKNAVYGLSYGNCVQKLEVTLLALVLSPFGAMSVRGISDLNMHHCSHSHLIKLHLIYTRIIDDSLKFLI